MRTRCIEPLQPMRQHSTEKRGDLRWMKLCWQRDVIEQQLQGGRLGPDERGLLKDMLATINNQLKRKSTPSQHLGL